MDDNEVLAEGRGHVEAIQTEQGTRVLIHYSATKARGKFLSSSAII